VAAAGLAALGLATIASQSGAFVLRVPQVPVLGGSLQAYLNSEGETINVLTDQVNAQVWSASASGNSVLTLMIELAGNADFNSLGIYNADVGASPLFQIFPGGAIAGWHAMVSFKDNGSLVVTLFDENSIVQGQVVYADVHSNSYGFYIQGPGGTFYSQDGKNPGAAAQILTYAGTGQNFGEWWICFEDTGLGNGSDQDYDDVVAIMESVVPVATKAMTLGGVKALYR
jgi:hypothetical protein